MRDSKASKKACSETKIASEKCQSVSSQEARDVPLRPSSLRRGSVSTRCAYLVATAARMHIPAPQGVVSV